MYNHKYDKLHIMECDPQIAVLPRCVDPRGLYQSRPRFRLTWWQRWLLVMIII